MKKETTSKFIKIRCPKCKNEQTIYGNSSTLVTCLVCSRELVYPTGGKAKISARVLDIY
jgi:small subunit ribosomal protein S27e